jgi:hypothetical protein
MPSIPRKPKLVRISCHQMGSKSLLIKTLRHRLVIHSIVRAFLIGSLKLVFFFFLYIYILVSSFVEMIQNGFSVASPI